MIKRIFYVLYVLCSVGLYAPPLSYRNLALIQSLPSAGKGVLTQYSLAAGKAYLKWIRNAYQFGQKESPTIRLLNDPRLGLFNLNGTAFRTTQNKANPAYALQGPVAGRLFYGVNTNKIFEDAFKNELVDLWRDYYKQQFPKDSLSAKRIDDMLMVVRRSIEESQAENSLYVPSITKSILLGHQTLKDQPLENVIEAYKELQALGVTDFTLAPHPEALFTDLQLEILKKKLEDTYDPSEKIELLFKNPELTVATEMYLQEQVAQLPAAPMQGSFCYKGSYPVPNCVETLVHDLVNLIVYDPTTRSFNPEKMVPSVKLNQQALSFYQAHPEIDAAGVDNSRQDWFNLVSGVPTIAYNKQGSYELLPHFSNLVAVLNYIFNTQAKTLDELGTLLSTPGHRITFAVQESSHYDTDVCRVTIEGLPGYFDITVSPIHGYLTRSVSEQSASSLFDEKIHQILEYDHTQENRDALLPLFMKKNKHKFHYPVHEMAVSTYVNYDLQDPNQLLSSIGTLINRISRMKDVGTFNRALAQEALSLLEKMPLDDDHFSSGVIRCASKLKGLIPQEDSLQQPIDILLEPLIKKDPAGALGELFNAQVPIDFDYLIRFLEKYTQKTDYVQIDSIWDKTSIAKVEEIIFGKAPQDYALYKKQLMDKINNLPDNLAIFFIENFLVYLIDKAPVGTKLDGNQLKDIEALLAQGDNRIKQVAGRGLDLTFWIGIFSAASFKREFEHFYMKIAHAVAEKIISRGSMQAGIMLLEEELPHVRKLFLNPKGVEYGYLLIPRSGKCFMTALLAEMAHIQGYLQLADFSELTDTFFGDTWSSMLDKDADFRETFIRGYETRIKPLRDTRNASYGDLNINADNVFAAFERLYTTAQQNDRKLFLKPEGIHHATLLIARPLGNVS